MIDFLKEPLAAATAVLTLLLLCLKAWKSFIRPKVIQPILDHFSMVHNSARLVQEIKKELVHNGGSSLKDLVSQLLRDQKDFGQSLSRLEGLVQAILSVSDEGVWVSDEHGHCLWVNGWFAQNIGWMPHEMLGSGWKNTIHADCRDSVFREWEECIKEHRDFIMKFDYASKGGSTVSVSARCSPMRQKIGGMIIGHVGFVQSNNEAARDHRGRRGATGATGERGPRGD